ncbi:hypothetical protein ACLESO_50835 [Pyxidicoccus sp. 3LG]
MLSADQREALRRELSFLPGDADGARTLDRLLDRVLAATLHPNGERTLRFESPHKADASHTWTVLLARGESDPAAPPALRRILEHCAGSWVGEPGTSDAVVLHDGFDGTLSALGHDLGLKTRRDGFEYSPSLCAPIDVGLGRVYLFHPVTGELRHFDQDGGLEPGDCGDVGTRFLALVEEALT